MDILPAIDLRGGKVVRLQKGDYNRQTTYGDDPLAVARQFVGDGTSWIHVVDLDAARSGELTNTAFVRQIVRQVGPDVRVQNGGGVRDTARVKDLLAAGVWRVVIGSAALKDWAWFESLLDEADIHNDRLALGLDARDGKVAAQGWTEQLDLDAEALARRVDGSGLGAIVYTDIARDGMLSGVNLPATQRIVQAGSVPVVASGGVCSLEDIRQCKQVGCDGVILGKALYEKRIDLPEALNVARS
jgi:phosphoribosylformimino-5-aminoimidazole carboxamide ribotide isomerase